MISRFWCVLEVPVTATQSEHAALISSIHESVRFHSGSFDAVDVGIGTLIYVEFDDLHDFLAFRLVSSHMTAYGLGDKCTSS